MKSTFSNIFSFLLALTITVGFYFLARYEVKQVDEGNYWWWFASFLNIPFYVAIYYAWKSFIRKLIDSDERTNDGFCHYDID